MIRLIFFLVALCASACAQLRPVHTFSIVARDPATGEMGVAVQSHWFSVGSIVSWAEAGVGAVATQSFVDPSYGSLGLELMRAGKTAPDALRALLESDDNRDVRQVAMIDSQARAIGFTGCRDIAAAGHHVGGKIIGRGGWVCRNKDNQKDEGTSAYAVGQNYSVQANLMSNENIWPAMAKAFESAKGDLADRMLAALDAAQAAGGDIRGRQSAALIVVSGKSTGKPWVDRIFDLRVDDSAEPLKDLRKLVVLQRAYNHMNAGDLATEHKDNEAALREYAAAEQLAAKTEGIQPTRYAEMLYWHAVALVNMGKVEDALPLFRKAFELHPGWRELTPRLPKSGLLPDDPKIIRQIVSQGN